MEEQTIIKNSLLKIFRLNGFPDAAKMTQRNYEHISTEIKNKTGIMLSSTTIKRLSHGEFSKLPQVATLDAIARYFGFTNWQEYKASEEGPGKKQETNDPPVNATPARPLFRVVFIALVVVSIVVTAFVMTRRKTVSGDWDKVMFSAKKITDNQLPNTVVFTYDVDNVNADSFFIQQSWDDRKRIRVYKNHYTVTDIYYEPGYHLAKLIANDSAIRVVEVSIPTDRWVFYANEQKEKYRTEYIDVEKPISNGVLGISKETLIQNGIDTRQNFFYTYSFFPTRQNVSGDNFTMKTRVRMKEVKNSLCPFITLEVFCQRYYMIIKSTEKGCASEAFVLLGDKKLEGKKMNLENIAYNLAEWNDIELHAENKNVTIKINGAVALETSYEQSTKNIAGLAFISNGLCEVDYVDVTGNDGAVVYKSEFDN